MADAVRIGLIGCGRWGKNILRDLLLLGCDVHVAEHREKNRALALDAGASSVCYDQSELPNEMDGYVIAVPTARHYETLLTLENSVAPIFIEKPMVPSLEQAEDIAQRMGDRVFVMHKWRYHPGIEKIAELRASNKYGKLEHLRTRRLQWMQPHKDVDAFWILAPHDVSIIMHILGDLPKIKAVQAMVTDNDIHALTAFLGNYPSVEMSVSDIHPKTERLVSAKFERAVVSMTDPCDDFLHIRYLDADGTPGEEVSKIQISKEFPLIREIRSFVDYISGGPKPFSCVADEIKMMQVLHSLRTEALASAG
ncbi:Gfo/Idh/MocA family oxidoreductase [Kordiimonas sp. SCSIO 12603]|uniref:Gfo/Idh/MocA family protein n=1 Tax=Kordiimonas sp. SCSIO 12603 TaxID=2829596 RepID=UPI002101ED9D|nr:Gfo/Idh/MocA family oxidoreductase [Kordiimonas sp. SCSIO 12603]UTW56983.1 Gfo/Idh/MocA family oxidoreductase [Kordiimonas sp. SCSIO 12603]